MRNSVLSRGNGYIPQKLGSLGILEHRSFGKEVGAGGEALCCRPVLGVLPLEFSLSQGRAIHVLSPRRPEDPTLVFHTLPHLRGCFPQTHLGSGVPVSGSFLRLPLPGYF